MKPIFEIAKNYLSIIDKIEEAGGEITEQQEILLTINKSELQTKSIAYVSIIKSLESEQKTIDSEIKRLQALKKARQGIVSNLKERLKNAMQTFGIDEIKTELVRICFRTSKSVVINCDIQDLPDDCKKIKVEAISKTELKKLIDSGRKIDGVEIIENLNLQIK